MASDVQWQHPLFKKHKHQVELCMNCYEGIDKVRQYLTPRPKEEDTDFANRQEKAVFSNFIERISTTQAGMIFSKPVTYEDVPDKIVELLDELNIAEFAKEVSKRAIRDGKSYVLVDMGINGGEPYFTHVDRSNLINWRKDGNGNLTMAVICESYEDVDGFKIEYKPQYRVLKEDGNVDIYREVDGEGFVLYETIVTSYNFLPLYELSVSDVPTLYDIATININHFNAYSEKDSVISITTQPVLSTRGLGLDDGAELKIGSSYTVNTDNYESSIEWVELTGQSIPFAQDDLDRKEKLMADRALQIQSESQKVQTATQVSIENSESTSRLSDIAEDLENTLMAAYGGWYQMKYSQDAVGEIHIPMDFKSEVVDSNIVIGLNNLVIAGNLSKQTMLEALIKHEIVVFDSVDEELARIDEEFIPVEEVSNGTDAPKSKEA